MAKIDAIFPAPFKDERWSEQKKFNHFGPVDSSFSTYTQRFSNPSGTTAEITMPAEAAQRIFSQRQAEANQWASIGKTIVELRQKKDQELANKMMDFKKNVLNNPEHSYKVRAKWAKEAMEKAGNFYDRSKAEKDYNFYMSKIGARAEPAAPSMPAPSAPTAPSAPPAPQPPPASVIPSFSSQALNSNITQLASNQIFTPAQRRRASLLAWMQGGLGRYSDPTNQRLQKFMAKTYPSMPATQLV